MRRNWNGGRNGERKKAGVSDQHTTSDGAVVTVGDTIDLTLKNVTVTAVSGEQVTVTSALKLAEVAWPWRNAAVSNVRSMPLHWPPQRGDVWRYGDDRSEDFFVIVDVPFLCDDLDNLFAISAAGNSFPASDLKNCRLVYRVEPAA
jgi:hypothetical protein